MNINDYQKDPCRYSALPLYKENRYINESVVVKHNDEFDPNDFRDYRSHQRYFRLLHSVGFIERINIEGYYLELVNPSTDIDLIVDLINNSYDKISITNKRVIEMVDDTVYHPSLWRFIIEEKSNKAVALGICHYDNMAKEVDFDWIQVLPSHRNLGLGKMLVTDLLGNCPSEALFATVSGDINNPHSPEKLYRKCGFTGEDIWHILQK